MRERKRKNIFYACLFERIDGGLECGAGGDDVVEDYISVGGVGAFAKSNRTPHVFPARFARKRDLRCGFPCAEERVTQYFNSYFFCRTLCDFFCLIESALAEPFRSERHRNNDDFSKTLLQAYFTEVFGKECG